MSLSHPKKHPQQMDMQKDKSKLRKKSREVYTLHLLMSKQTCNSLLFNFKVFCKERSNSAMGNTGPNSLPLCKHTSDFTEVAYLLLLSNLGLCPCLVDIKNIIRLSLQ